MKNNLLQFNLSIIVPETELVIKDLDIDFNIYKSNKPKNNMAYLNIWNLKETKYQQLIAQGTNIEIYASYGEDEPILIFRGDIDHSKLKNGTFKDEVDTSTQITLIDGYEAFSTFINRNYRTKISSTQILQDIIKDMNIEQGEIEENLTQRQYNSFKAYGRAPAILEKICSPLGIKYSIHNNLINLRTNRISATETDNLIFTENNCRQLRHIGKDEILLTTSLMPNLAPDDIIRCEFENLDGDARINDIHHFGDNYCSAETTEITLEVLSND